MKFVIVKNASDERWPYFWKEDPKKTGIIITEESAKKYPELSISYTSLDKAQEALVELQKQNPGIDYGICPISGYNIAYHMTGAVS